MKDSCLDSQLYFLYLHYYNQFIIFKHPQSSALTKHRKDHNSVDENKIKSRVDRFFQKTQVFIHQSLLTILYFIGIADSAGRSNNRPNDLYTMFSASQSLTTHCFSTLVVELNFGQIAASHSTCGTER
jgi:hypothetical protein